MIVGVRVTVFYLLPVVKEWASFLSKSDLVHLKT